MGRLGKSNAPEGLEGNIEMKKAALGSTVDRGLNSENEVANDRFAAVLRSRTVINSRSKPTRRE